MKSLILLILGTIFFTPVSSQITITSQQEWNDLINGVTPYYPNVIASGIIDLSIGNASTPNPTHTSFRNLSFINCTFQDFDLDIITSIGERFTIQDCDFSNVPVDCPQSFGQLNNNPSCNC